MFDASPIRFWSRVTDPSSMPWEDVERALRECEHYWLATVSATGTPSVRPVWGMWMDERLLLSIGSTTVGRNLDHSRTVTVHLESALDVVIAEGEASYEQDTDVLARFCELYNPKYRWDFTPTTTGAIVAVAPTRILTWKTVPAVESKSATFPLAGATFRPG